MKRQKNHYQKIGEIKIRIAFGIKTNIHERPKAMLILYDRRIDGESN